MYTPFKLNQFGNPFRLLTWKPVYKPVTSACEKRDKEDRQTNQGGKEREITCAYSVSTNCGGSLKTWGTYIHYSSSI